MSGIKENVSWCIWRFTGAVLSLLSVETKTNVVVWFCLFAFLSDWKADSDFLFA